MIGRKDLEHLNGLMEKYIEDIGKMENKMVKVNFISLLIINGKNEFGKQEKEFLDELRTRNGNLEILCSYEETAIVNQAL